MSQTARATTPILYLVSLSPNSVSDEDFNRWYDEIHVPELLACPGFLAARRYRLVSGIEGSFTYIASYEVESMAAFESDEYLALQRRTPEDLPPLAQLVVPDFSVNMLAKYEPTSPTRRADVDS